MAKNILSTLNPPETSSEQAPPAGIFPPIQGVFPPGGGQGGVQIKFSIIGHRSSKLDFPE